MKHVFSQPTELISRTPADAHRAEVTDPVLEIVTFRLKSDVNEPEFLKAAAGTEKMLRDRGALVRRYLVRDESGLWSDVIEWTSMAAALSAAEAVMQHPDFAPFGGMIDGPTVEMRHAPIRWRMD